MYKMLVVDDILYAVEGVVGSHDWTTLGIDETLEAYDVPTAVKIMESRPIDVLICDIEMPEKNGFDLLEWVVEHSPRTVAILLTGHAEFEYAKRAIRLGSFEYLLKPVDYDELYRTVAMALGEVSKEQESERFRDRYNEQVVKWEAQLPLLVERFWQDVVNQRLLLTPETLGRMLELYRIPEEAVGRVIPVLISVEEWKGELSARDEEIMEYALRNAAKDILLHSGGAVVQDRNGINIAILYGGASALFEAELQQACDAYLEVCRTYFGCQLSCYIGAAVTIADVASQVKALKGLERRNVGTPHSVQFLSKAGDERSPHFAAASFQDWGVLLESCKREELLRRIESYFAEVEKELSHHELYEEFHYGFLYMLHSLFHRKGLTLSDVYESGMQPPVGRQQWKGWALRLAGEGIDYLERHDASSSALIRKIKTYIREHLDGPCTREDIAASVYLNPAYLSRLFKKETGSTLSDYIAAERMSKAKKLLAETQLKIVNISEAVGFANFSYFTQSFKKVVGMVPQEYRKNFQG
ncbi:helix-turn-helix domain-containing protein [Paenibacillus sp. GCM10027626]|uniref:helix-turn-helix domain-containing protein n=1 Tax=Paenibacillus sp. GCM10027626 TaxID=3273411 RepID=UPI00362AAC10